jgi:hypothetical protein
MLKGSSDAYAAWYIKMQAWGRNLCTLSIHLFDVQLLRLGGEHIVSKNSSLDKFTKPMLLGTLRHKLRVEVHCKHLFF